MSKFIEIIRPSRKSNKKNKESTFNWKSYLQNYEKGKGKFVVVDAFNDNLLINCNDIVKEGVVFETIVHDYDPMCDGVEARWFVRIEKVAGYRVLGRFVADDNPANKFWMHILSEEAHHLAHAAMSNKIATTVYVPPPNINLEYEKDIENHINNAIDTEMKGQQSLSPSFEHDRTALHVSRFRVGQRLELLNYNNSRQIRVARIKDICGRRLNVQVMNKDNPSAQTDDGEEEETEDRQAEGYNAQYWIDEASFLIFPVGFAAVNGIELQAQPDYKKHTKKIADAIRQGSEPVYMPEDVTFDDLKKDEIDMEHWDKVKIGQKFELIDPLAQQFQNLHVATILRFLTTPGYIVIGMDGSAMEEDSFPLHISNPFIYPVGYAKKYGMELEKPDNCTGSFNWSAWLEKEKAEEMPIELFRPMPTQERLNKFKVGMHLEAADMCENHFICPATIIAVHGRIINVNFDGWDAEFDELYDIDSHDIFPVGWCELHGYCLQHPKRSNY